MAKIIRKMLTTTDNPFDPFDEFEKWNARDIALGYGTLQYLARTVDDDQSLFGEYVENDEWNKQVDIAYKLNLTGNRVLVSREFEL